MGFWKISQSIICLLFVIIGCAPSWQGRIVYLENNKLVIQPETDVKIKNGQKLMISRQKTITHPVTNEELGMIKDNIAEAIVTKVNNKTVVASVSDPWFDMMMVDDNAKAIRGLEKQSEGSVIEIGKIKSNNEDNKTAEISFIKDKPIFAGEVLTVVKYVNIITDPESGEIIAVSVEPIANVSQKPDGKFYYELIDKILGWVEYDDVLVKRTGSMIKETNWFQDPPENLSEDILFKRNYLRAVRDINKGMYKEAMLELEIVSKIDPSYENIGYFIGLCYAKLNRYDDAVKYFTEYLKKNENDAKSWTELAYLYLRQNNFSDAIKAYERLSKLIPDNPHIWVDMGDIYRQLGNIQKAKEAYLKALEIDPINEQAEYELK